MPRRTAKSASTPSPDGPLDFDKSSQKLSQATFFRYAAEYPNQEGTSLYVYQLLPKNDRRKVGINTSYIAVYKEPITEAFLLRTHGSGRYWLTLTDANAPKGTTERATSTVEVYHPEIPNKIDPAELVLDDKNSQPWLDELRARGILKGETVATQQGGNEAVGVLADMTKRLFEDREKKGGIEKELTPIILKLLDRNSIDDAFKIAQQLKPAESPLNAEILKLLIGRQNPEPKDPFENYERIEKMMERLASKAGGGGKTSGWSEFMQAAPGLLQSGMALLGTILSIRSGQPTPPAMPAQPSRTAEPMLPPGELDMMNPATIRALQATGEKAIRAFERGITGEHFAAALCVEEEGERTYDVLHTLGKDGILQALSMIPGLTERLAPRRAEIELWLESFISYAEVEPSEVVQ